METKVELYREPTRFGLSCIVHREGINGNRQVLRYVDGLETWEDTDGRSSVEPTYYFPTDVLTKIVELSEGMVPRPRVEVSDLLLSDVADARMIRDRLLSLVEKNLT